jgi:type VI secretion system protein ImpC
MSGQTEREAPALTTTGDVTAPSLLDRAIAATKQTEPDRAEALLRTLTEEALSGTVTYSRNLTVTINQAIAALDKRLSEQLAVVMHHPEFVQLEGSWRGLRYLVFSSETSVNLKIKVLNASKKEVGRDLSKATEFDQSLMFKSIYENEFGTPGGEPFGALIGNYEFSRHYEDIELLRGMSNIAAAGFCPFISAASPELFGFQNFSDLSRPRDLEKIFDTQEYVAWRSYRESEDSRFVTLALPRVLSRLPYGRETRPIEEFNFEEGQLGANGAVQALPHEHYCWMNAAFVLGTRLTDAFSKNGWCTAIRGAENGGKVEQLPMHVFSSDDGDTDLKCPTEVGITDRRDNELAKLGFLPLCHYKNTDYAVFFGAQTTHKPKKYDKVEATENAAISARLPYLMATSRFAHYLKVIGRDKIGSFMEAAECETWLNRWIQNYANSNQNPGPAMKLQYPLREARVTVNEVPGRPGSYNAVAWMRPWLQLEELTTSMRLVARIPKAN